MTFGPPPSTIKRGRMSPEEKKELERVICSMKKPTPGKVAVKVNRHPATVNWYMLTHGHITRKPGRAPGPYQRYGKTVYPWSEEHDEFILDLRTQGVNKQEIGRRVTAKFGIERNHHQVDVRLRLLAAAPDEIGPATKPGASSDFPSL